MNSIFIFRREFRLHDNLGLIEALKNSKKVLPIFILTPSQVTKNPFKSDNAVQFMIESLEELDKELRKKGSKLHYFYGQPHKIIEQLIKKHNIDSVYANQDYTPYAQKRDKLLQKTCRKLDAQLFLHEDYLLNPVESIKTGSNTPYTKFTPYLDKAKNTPVQKPKKNSYSNYFKVQTAKIDIHKFYKKYNEKVSKGGRTEALKILQNTKRFKSYNSIRNDLSFETTRLSAYIKFGCVSIREVYHKFISTLGKNNDLIKQLYWRDFYYQLAFFHPYVFGNNFRKRKIVWKNTNFKKWCDGKTGYPVIDACMRQLNETGYMHNRGRLMVANFLIKLLLVDWQTGEKYFAQKLVDYDPCVNNGNWQWVAGTGVDYQSRIYNPASQSLKYDPQAKYIKFWIPELKEVPAKDIHNWQDTYQNYDVYIEPVIDYKKARKDGSKYF